MLITTKIVIKNSANKLRNFLQVCPVCNSLFDSCICWTNEYYHDNGYFD